MLHVDGRWHVLRPWSYGTHARGRGVGRSPVKHAANAARAAGCVDRELTTNPARTDAHEFYRALGFAQTSYRFHRSLKFV